jgi:hypothetical protein
MFDTMVATQRIANTRYLNAPSSDCAIKTYSARCASSHSESAKGTRNAESDTGNNYSVFDSIVAVPRRAA